MAQKRQPEEPQRESIKTFEEFRDVYAAYDERGAEIAFLTATQGAMADDIAAFAGLSLPRCTRTECVAEVMYALWETEQWRRLRRDKPDEAEDGKLPLHLANRYARQFMDMKERHTVGPMDPKRRQAYHDRKEAERRERIERTLAAPANDGVDPVIADLLRQREQLDKKITKEQSRVAQEQHRRMTQRREQAQAVTVGG